MKKVYFAFLVYLFATGGAYGDSYNCIIEMNKSGWRTYSSEKREIKFNSDELSSQTHYKQLIPQSFEHQVEFRDGYILAINFFKTEDNQLLLECYEFGKNLLGITVGAGFTSKNELSPSIEGSLFSGPRRYKVICNTLERI
jgi:hypothetical protein